MTTKEFERVGKSLIKDLPGLAATGKLLLLKPITHTLRGVCFDGSGFDSKEFYAAVFLQPMFVPADCIALNIGWRLGGGCHTWNMFDPDLATRLAHLLKTEALPFLHRAESPKGFADAAASLNKTADPYTQQSVAYALALAGETGKSIVELDKLNRLLNENISWQSVMADRARALKAELKSDLNAVQKRLASYRTNTILHLGLQALAQA